MQESPVCRMSLAKKKETVYHLYMHCTSEQPIIDQCNVCLKKYRWFFGKEILLA